jgi:hypothetical protein
VAGCRRATTHLLGVSKQAKKRMSERIADFVDDYFDLNLRMNQNFMATFSFQNATSFLIYHKCLRNNEDNLVQPVRLVNPMAVSNNVSAYIIK